MRPKPINLAALAGGRRHTRPANRTQGGRSAVALRDWYRITNESGSATVSIYDEIGYWGVTAAQFCDELGSLDATSIDVRINSPGGDMYDGLAIYNALLNHPADVTTHVDGMAASIASVIMQAGDVRVMARASQSMIHEPFGLCVGNAADMAGCAAVLDKAADMIAEVYADRGGGSAATWRAAMRTETWYSAQETVDAGLADAVQGAAAAENSFDLSVFCYAGRDAAPAPPVLTWDPEAFRRAVKEAVR